MSFPARVFASYEHTASNSAANAASNSAAKFYRQQNPQELVASCRKSKGKSLDNLEQNMFILF